MPVDVSQETAFIRQAINGREVRESLAGGIDKIADEVNNFEGNIDNRQNSVETRQTNLENTFTAEIENAISENPSSAETVGSRTDNVNNITYDTLGARLDNQASQMADNVLQINSLDNNKANKIDVNNALGLKADLSALNNTNAVIESNYLDLDTKINSQTSGSPKGVFTTVSALQNDSQANTSDGKKNIYIVINPIEDGKDYWYYWNGSAWTSGGVYQSTGIADQAVAPENTTFAQRGKNKWDGAYVTNLRLGGGLLAGFYVYAETNISVIFRGEKGKTYTISKSNDTDRYGVATFVEKPITPGMVPNRGINDNSVPYSKLTITLQGEEQYIFIYLSSNGQQKIPAQFQIEEGSEATEYSSPNAVILPLEEKSVPLEALDLSKIQIAPENTTFAQRGKNLWDGKFINDIRLSGESPYIIATDVGAISVLFKGEKNKTYTISKSDDSDYFGIATFTTSPDVGVSGNRGINGNFGGQTPKTITLQGEEQYIVVGVSSSTTSKAPSWIQIEEGSEATEYSSPNAVKITLEQDTTISTIPKINAIKSGDTLSIYVPSKTSPNRYIRHNYNRHIDATQNCDTWLLDSTGIYTKSNGMYNLEFMVSTSSDNEGVLAISGEADFIGGKHGYDILESLDVIIDGKAVNMAQDFNAECSFINIVNKSRVLHDGTTDAPENKAFTRYKIHTFILDGMSMEGKWIAVNETTVSTAKLCDFSVNQVDSNVNIAKWGRNNEDYTKMDVSGDFGATESKHGVTKQEIWSADTNFYLGLGCNWDLDKYPNSYARIERLEGIRAKMYFDITGEYTFQAGEEIKYKNTYDFRF